MINKTTDFTFSHVNQQDELYKTMTAAQVKAAYDSRGNELRTFIDGLIDILNSIVDGASGADNIGATAITDLEGTTVQSLIESLRNKLKSIVDGSSGADFVAATGITGLEGQTVQSLLESLKSYIDTYNTNHKLATSTDHDNRYVKLNDSYTKAETNNLVAGVTLGQIPDNSLSEIKMASDMKKDIEGGITSYNTFTSQMAQKATQESLNATNSNVSTLQVKLTDYNSYASGIDSNGIYTIVDYKRADGTLYMKSTLSGGTSPNYTTDTWQFYDVDGSTLLTTKTWTITYDVNGKITSKVVA